jgi:hypothetical protein
LHTQVIVLETILSITRGIRVPVCKGGDPSGQCPRRFNVWSERVAQRTEHYSSALEELDTDVPGCRVCQCLGDVAAIDKISAV